MALSPFPRLLAAGLAAGLLAIVSSVALAAIPTLQELNQAFRQGRHASALEKANAYLGTNPKEPQGRFLKGLILTELNRSAEAIKVFSSLSDDYPELPEPYNNLAVLYAAQGDYDRAKQSLEMAIRTHPSYTTAHENLGDIYAKMASQAYDKALQLDMTNVSAQTKLAMIRDLFSPAPRPEAPARGKAKPSGKAGGLTKDTTPVAAVAAVAAVKPKTEEAPVVPQAVAETPVKPVAEKPAEPAKLAEAPKASAVVAPVVVAEKPAEPSVPAEVAKPKQTEAAKPAPAEEKSATKPVEPPKKSAVLGKRPKDVAGSIEYDIRAWAAAWAAQDVKAYLAHYGTDFKPPKGKKRSAWEEERRDRLSRAEFIRVEISDIKVSHKGGPVAKAKFRQRYQSNILDNTTGKTLVLKKQGDAWKIIGEF